MSRNSRRNAIRRWNESPEGQALLNGVRRVQDEARARSRGLDERSGIDPFVGQGAVALPSPALPIQEHINFLQQGIHDGSGKSDLPR